MTIAPEDPAPGLLDPDLAVPARELTDLMEAVRDNAARLLAGMTHPPTALRLRVGAVEMALEWQAGGAVAAVPPPTAPPGAPAVATAGEAAPAPAAMHLDSPTVGVFYHAPDPGSAPFVEVGDAVAPGQQVGIVEVMKLMIPVEADKAGRITAVLVGNGEQVAYGEPLFTLEPVTSDGR